jgi:short-chain fatty acids transporter
VFHPERRLGQEFWILLTFAAFGLAWALTDSGPLELVGMWGDGLWEILGFAMQMILILVTGHALASSAPVRALLRRLASIPKTSVQAAMLTVLVAAVACFLNWGFGLIVGALLAKELARRMERLDYGLVVAAAYSGFVVWHGGLSGSIPLAIATKGHIVEAATGIVPVTETIFSARNLPTTWALIVSLPLLFGLMAKKSGAQGPEAKAVAVPPEPEPAIDAAPAALEAMTPAARIERSVLLNGLFGAVGVFALGRHFAVRGFDLSLNTVILFFLVLGVILHRTPIAYVRAVEQAIKGAGGIALQFPLYGGIQGIMVTSGLAAVIAHWFISFSTATTFPLFSFFAGGIINFSCPRAAGNGSCRGLSTSRPAWRSASIRRRSRCPSPTAINGRT